MSVFFRVARRLAETGSRDLVGLDLRRIMEMLGKLVVKEEPNVRTESPQTSLRLRRSDQS